MSTVIGVDTGGTFTDVVVLREDGARASAKASTTAEDLATGILSAVDEVARSLSLTAEELLADAELFRVSGTTVTNALLTGHGIGSTGLLTTAGFEDTLHIGRGLSGWTGRTEEEIKHVFARRKPVPLVPKSLVRGITERIDATGAVVVAGDSQQIEQAASSLAAAGAESIAVCFLWAVKNPTHEILAGKIIKERFPGISVHLSHRVAQSVGEYERFTTTVIDALVGGVMQRLLSRIREMLGAKGFSGHLVVAQADGGSVYADDCRPVYTLSSGPAAGVIASKDVGVELGVRNIVTADVGGTSFDVAVIAEGNVEYAREPVAGQYSLSLPMINVESVGAGGGSIGWLDELGVLHVGPASAGANPGPVCYGRGGTRPTVTDAALALGYVNPDYFLGGRVKLDVESTMQALAGLGEPLGLNAVGTACGIFEIANAHMAGLIVRRVLARGYDPRDFVIFAFGGAGGMHGAFCAKEARIGEVIVPGLGGSFSALGVATAPLLHSARRDDYGRVPTVAEQMVRNFEELEAEVNEMLDRDGLTGGDRRLVYVLEMRYGFQVHTVRLVIDPDTWRNADFDKISHDFDETYERHYGKGSGYSAAGRFIAAYIVEGYGVLPIPGRSAGPEHGEDSSAALIGQRDMFFDGRFQPGSIYRFDLLKTANKLRGPAIVEASEMTVVVPPDSHAWLDAYNNVHISVSV